MTADDLDSETPGDAPDELTLDPSVARRGFVEDCVSGQLVRATPEEEEALQVFARRLMEDYGYPKAHLQTRPQHRVRYRPSAGRGSYPIDIAVFRNDDRREDNLFMVVECKRRERKDGIEQLRLYLDMSPAEIGAWFNGEDHYYIRKILHQDGTRSFQELSNIPLYGQRIEDIGLNRRADLAKPSNLRSIFKDIRNFLAPNAAGVTRDERLAQEVINLLFCKIHDEVNTGLEDIVSFRRGLNEDPRDVHKRILDLYDEVKIEYPDVFDESDSYTLDPVSTAYIVGELQPYTLIEADRDAIGDAFEVFIGPALRGPEGQFFTPRNVVRALVDMVDPQPGEMLIDPACGSGGFLTVALEHVWRKMEAEAAKKGTTAAILERRKRDIATRTFRGLDKDDFLAKCTKAYMAIIGDGRGGVFRADSSLHSRESWPAQVREKIYFGQFDVVLTNPPFGKKIRVTGDDILAQYDMGHKWTTNRTTGQKELSDKLQKDFPPQLLFLERCLQLLKPGGRLGIVLPESLFGSPSYGHIISWLQTRARIKAIAAMPEPLFKTSGKQGTHTKVCIVVLEKLPVENASAAIFMADAKWCGHDSRGNATIRTKSNGQEELLDDVPVIAQRYRDYVRGNLVDDHLGFAQPRSDVIGTTLVPKYYDPEVERQLENLEPTHETPRLGEYVDAGQISVTTGIEVGKMAYGTGPVPFIRTSDLSNWELKADPKHGVSEELYRALKRQHPERLDVQAGDILMVKDGTYLVGTSAVVSSLDERMLYQSHLYKIRVHDSNVLNPWLLFAALNSPVAKRQIRAKRFTQDIIDTLGNRLFEVRIPLPRDAGLKERVARETEEAIQRRASLREQARSLAMEIEGEAAYSDLSSLEEAD